jgi:hypothetical protein
VWSILGNFPEWRTAACSISIAVWVSERVLCSLSRYFRIGAAARLEVLNTSCDEPFFVTQKGDICPHHRTDDEEWNVGAERPGVGVVQTRFGASAKNSPSIIPLDRKYGFSRWCIPLMILQLARPAARKDHE